MFGQLLLQIILIALNAFFAATEIAVISLNEKKVRALADNGDKKAQKMLKIIEAPTRFLSTIQIGITLAGFLGSAFAADNFAERITQLFINAFNVPVQYQSTINTVSVIVVTLILSYFTLVLGELVPKRVAMKHKEKLANAVCGVISFLATALRPIIWFLTASTNAVLRIVGIDPNEKEAPVSEEDIVLMLDAGADEGSIDKDDIEYIKNVFKLDRMIAEDVMTPWNSVVCLNLNSTEDEIDNVISESGYSRIPVYDEQEENIIGILYARDYLLCRGKDKTDIGKLLHQPVIVPETAKLDMVFKNMQSNHNHLVIVVNEYGETSGIVSMEDILEEIVGEIWDERDEEVTEFLETESNSVRILCTAPIDDFFEYFALDPEETEAATINGWLTEKLGKIPEKNYNFKYNNLNITVTDANEFMVKEITVKHNDKN